MTTSAPVHFTPQKVMELVYKLEDPDPDSRFMSLNDLHTLLTKAKPGFLNHEYNIAAKTVDGVLKVIDDQNGEVQNLAIKCLGPLINKVPPAIIAPMIDRLSSMKLQNSVDSAIPSLALRSVITALQRPVPGAPVTQAISDAYSAVSRVLIPRLTGPGPKVRVPKTVKLKMPPVPPGLLQADGEGLLEAVDVLIEVLRCFGPLLQQLELESIVDVVLHLLEGPRGTANVKRRAVVAISMVAVYLNDENLEGVVNHVTTGLKGSSTPSSIRRLYISIMGSMARSVPARVGPSLSRAVPSVLQTLSDAELQQHLERVSEGDDVGPEFNELRETALVALEAFLASCPQEMKAFTDETISSCIRYLKYDPNYTDDGDDDEMSVDEDEDQDDEFEDDDEFGDDADDDDDASWKVRRCAAKALYTLISTRGSGDLLENGVLYSQAAPQLIKRIDEREENVRLEIISALSLLIRKTGEGLHTVDLAHDEYEPELIIHNPINRKRRRQSSGGGASAASFMANPDLGSPIAERIPAHGPRADLSRLTPSIVKAATKHLKGKTIPTKQAIVTMLDDLVSVQRGGLASSLTEMITLIIEAVKPSGSGSGSSSLASAGGASSATPGTLRVAALKLLSDILKTHSSAILQPYLAPIAAGAAAAVHDRFYKISSEALRTTEELVKTITPPRCQNAGVRYKGELERLYDVIMDRSSASDADAEVRQRAIHALGVLVSRTSTPEGLALLSAEKRDVALNILQERLKNETTRLAAVRAVDNIVAFTNTPGQLGKAWIQDVALELAAQLRKANRSLRGSSMKALRNLVLSGAARGQLEPATAQGIASALLPAIQNADTQLLGPAFLILASMVQDQHHGLFINEDMIGALCELLKSHFASIVLDQLLEFISRVGDSGTGGPLMRALLHDVSVLGDPGVVGKVIGTLLVTGGASAGVTLDSFVSELHNSAKGGDEARVSLALAVLGESGMRLGSASPLRPELFLEQFHDEPDRVSLSAAIALGRAGSGSVPAFMPMILETMQRGGNTQYLLIQSIKEILHSAPAASQDLRTFAKPIWQQLLGASSIADNRVVCAECVGRLTTLDPATFMPQLQTLLKDDSIDIRGMAVQAIRYTLPESDQSFDALLRNVLIDMLLTMLQDSDMEIRRLAMTTLNSAAHNKPDLILPHLGQLVPYVLSESVIRTELVREVMLGPFKHKVDDGLEVRKSAYETLYALMETAFTRINIIDFYDRVVAGLKDDNDIRQLCNLMVAKLISMDPDETVRRLDSIAEAYRGVLSVKLKDNAVKQDLEKQEETNKSILRVTLLLGEGMKAMTGQSYAATSNSAPAGVWMVYWEWVTKEFAKQIRSLREESKSFQTQVV